MPSASRPPDIDQYGPPRELRRSQRLTKGETDLMSTETYLNLKETDNVSEENDLGEQTFSCNALTLERDLSKLYQEKLAAAKSENDDPFSLGEEEEFFCPKPVLKPKRTISFSMPAPIVLLFPEKGENDDLS
jgi:hypothetical protein